MKMSYLMAMAFCMGLSACIPPQSTFFWGEYSGTLYNYKKTPDEKTFGEHKQSLFVIITESPKKKLPVPPGVYAEYGYMLILEGKEQEGMEYFDKEVALYPEAAIFIQRLKKGYKKGEGL